MDYTWGNTPGSPYYEPSDDELLELEYGIDPRSYYLEQAKCIERRLRYYGYNCEAGK